MSSQVPATLSIPSPPTLATLTFQHPLFTVPSGQPSSISNILGSVHGSLYSPCLLNKGFRREPSLTQMKDQLGSPFWCRRPLQAHLRPRNADSCLLCVRPSMTGSEEGFKRPGPEDRSHVYSSWRSESENEARRETDSFSNFVVKPKCSQTVRLRQSKSLSDLTQTLPRADITSLW